MVAPGLPAFCHLFFKRNKGGRNSLKKEMIFHKGAYGQSKWSLNTKQRNPDYENNPIFQGRYRITGCDFCWLCFIGTFRMCFLPPGLWRWLFLWPLLPFWQGISYTFCCFIRLVSFSGVKKVIFCQKTSFQNLTCFTDNSAVFMLNNSSG